jgi:ParB family transcriptional regulator, chromosome partitioning protein
MSKHFKPQESGADSVLSGVLKLGRPGERPEGPTTFVGRVGMQTGLGFAAENERLKAERAGGMVILRLDPKKVGYSEFKNRSDFSLDPKDEKLRALKDSILSNGQDTPIVVRPAASGGTIEYEIVAGHRRHAAIIQLDHEVEGGFPLFARLDAKAEDLQYHCLKMYRENADREDLTAWEYAMDFSRWLAAGVFKTQSELAEKIGRSKQNVAQHLGLLELPKYVFDAFRDPRTMALRWGTSLAKACRERGADVERAAAQVVTLDPPLTPDQVCTALLSAASAPSGDQPKRAGRASESIKEGNKVLFELSAREGRLGIRLGRHVDRKLHPKLQRELKDWLHTWLKKNGGGSPS